MTEKPLPTVFVVDDESVTASTLAYILNSSGFSARAFTDSLEALRFAETQCPDFLITDVMMPQLNGIDLGIQFKATYPSCRILLFSGVAATSDLISDAAKDGHHFELLAKPVPPKELLQTTRAL
jgi:CheY-like chemotaxis protein